MIEKTCPICGEEIDFDEDVVLHFKAGVDVHDKCAKYHPYKMEKIREKITEIGF